MDCFLASKAQAIPIGPPPIMIMEYYGILARVVILCIVIFKLISFYVSAT
jgi:hypothetical protein